MDTASTMDKISKVFDFYLESVLGVAFLFGVFFCLISFVLIVRRRRFYLRSRKVIARVADHVGGNAAKPVFEVTDSEHSSVRDKVSIEQLNRSYPLGSEWPAWLDPKSKRIRATHIGHDNMMLIVCFLSLGAGFITVPTLYSWQIGGKELTVELVFMVLGTVLVIWGFFYKADFVRRRRGFVSVSAKLVSYHEHVDREGDTIRRTVFRVMAGPYNGLETSDVWVKGLGERDVGVVLAGEFDPNRFRIYICDKQHRAFDVGLSLAFTGIAFLAVGLLLTNFG